MLWRVRTRPENRFPGRWLFPFPYRPPFFFRSATGGKRARRHFATEFVAIEAELKYKIFTYKFASLSYRKPFCRGWFSTKFHRHVRRWSRPFSPRQRNRFPNFLRPFYSQRKKKTAPAFCEKKLVSTTIHLTGCPNFV